jgi:hypothetical protein
MKKPDIFAIGYIACVIAMAAIFGCTVSHGHQRKYSINEMELSYVTGCNAGIRTANGLFSNQYTNVEEACGVLNKERAVFINSIK